MVTKHKHDKKARVEITDFEYLQKYFICFLFDEEPYKSQGIKHFEGYLVKINLARLKLKNKI